MYGLLASGDSMRKQIFTPLLVVLLAACAPAAPANYPLAASADGPLECRCWFPGLRIFGYLR